ncbi:hypothetical protein [Kitasatospora sp. NPDC088134]|uniref:hypothetical protein n=1 Tax=Kitasatospora sp. NPDC088134 TaxID=3364071 RepID=UPI0037FDAE27
MRTIIAATAVLLLASCGLQKEQLKPAVTKDEAGRQVLAYDAEIRQALLGSGQSAAPPGELSPLECEATDIPGPKGRVELSVRAVVASGRPEGNPAVFAAFERKVRELGFEPRRQEPGVRVFERPADRYVAELTESGDVTRTLRLTVASPCVWPNGTPG